MELCQSSIHSGQSSVYCAGWLVAVTIHEIACSGYRRTLIKLYYSDAPFTRRTKEAQGQLARRRYCPARMEKHFTQCSIGLGCVHLPIHLGLSLSCSRAAFCQSHFTTFQSDINKCELRLCGPLYADGLFIFEAERRRHKSSRSLHLKAAHCSFTFSSPGLCILKLRWKISKSK